MRGGLASRLCFGPLLRLLLAFWVLGEVPFTFWIVLAASEYFSFLMPGYAQLLLDQVLELAQGWIVWDLNLLVDSQVLEAALRALETTCVATILGHECKFNFE